MTEEGRAYDLKHRLLEYFERKRRQVPIVHGSLHGKSGIDPIPDAVYQEDPVYIRRADGTIINPSTEETLTSVLNKLADILARLDVALSTRASESTLTGVKAQTDKLTFDASSRLKAQLDSIPNPSNLDVLLSSRASESSLTSTLPRNITQWSGTPLTERDISLDIQYIGGHRFKNMVSGVTNYTFPAGQTVVWLSISGQGWLYIEYGYKAGDTNPLTNVRHQELGDGNRLNAFPLVDAATLSYYGYGATGNYDFYATGLLIVRKWDTTNNIFEAFTNHIPWFKVFRNTLTAQVINNGTVNSTGHHSMNYVLFTASKVIYVKMPAQAEVFDAELLKKKLVKQGIRPSAIVVQKLGYYDDPDAMPPIMREFPDDLPNKCDDERTTPDGKTVRSRRHDKADQYAEIHVDESVRTDDVIKVIQPAKFLKEEVF